VARRGGNQIFHTQEARIEIIPMIDIMMFLLVFFIMITLEMITNTGIMQELPGKAIPQEQQVVTKLIVGISPAGELSVNGQQIGQEALVETFARAKATEAQGAKVEVLIAGDKQVNLQRAIMVMDMARSQGIEAVGLATRADSEPSKNGKIL
jgi:biopolymer transport protein ExbD